MTLGTYLPAYFEVHIDTDEDLNNLEQLPPEVQALYFHEYCHFLQDLTTTFGLLKTWNVYDRLRQYIVSVQQGGDNITIPLENAAAERQTLYLRYILRLIGDERTDLPLLEDQFFSRNVHLVDDAQINEMIPGLHAQHVILTIGHNVLPDRTYQFGEMAISEGMVNLIQSKFYQLPPSPKFPYLIARELANFIYPAIGQTSELVFALCDVALMHPIPGWAYYTLLITMRDRDLIFDSGEGVINFGMDFYTEAGWHLNEQLDTAVQGIAYIGGQLYHHEHFQETLQWFRTIVARGREIRRQHPFFFLNIYRDVAPLGDALALPWMQLGGPHCINRAFARSIRIPGGLEPIAGQIHPQHLLISRQLNLFLRRAKISCDLHDICAHSEPNLTDERCDVGPWTRVTDEFGCPYAAAWAIYGFHQKRFELPNRVIEPIDF